MSSVPVSSQPSDHLAPTPMPHVRRFCCNSVPLLHAKRSSALHLRVTNHPQGISRRRPSLIRSQFGLSWAVQETALPSLTQHRGGVGGGGTVDRLENPLSRWLAHVAGSLLRPPRRPVQEAVCVCSQHGIWVSRGRKKKLPVLLRVGPRVVQCHSRLVLGPAQTHSVRSSMPHLDRRGGICVQRGEGSFAAILP